MKENNMMENTEQQAACYCECCHCKKVFMLLVLLILAFIAGIMVGHCQTSYPPYMMHHYAPQMVKPHLKAKKIHRGIHTTAPNAPANAQTSPDDQIGGFIIEVDSAE